MQVVITEASKAILEVGNSWNRNSQISDGESLVQWVQLF